MHLYNIFSGIVALSFSKTYFSPTTILSEQRKIERAQCQHMNHVRGTSLILHKDLSLPNGIIFVGHLEHFKSLSSQFSEPSVVINSPLMND